MCWSEKPEIVVRSHSDPPGIKIGNSMAFVEAIIEKRDRVKTILLGVGIAEDVATKLSDYSVHLSVYKTIAMDLGVDQNMADLFIQQLYAEYLTKHIDIRDQLLNLAKDPARLQQYQNMMLEELKRSGGSVIQVPTGEKAVVSNEAKGTLGSSDDPIVLDGPKTVQ
jgi:hypothetical protein